MFDPFKDFDAKGYLRNVVGEKDLNIVKQLEHDLFTANLADAMTYLAKKNTITYRDFLKVHALLFGDLYPWAGSDRMTTSLTWRSPKRAPAFAFRTSQATQPLGRFHRRATSEK